MFPVPLTITLWRASWRRDCTWSRRQLPRALTRANSPLMALQMHGSLRAEARPRIPCFPHSYCHVTLYWTPGKGADQLYPRSAGHIGETWAFHGAIYHAYGSLTRAHFTFALLPRKRSDHPCQAIRRCNTRARVVVLPAHIWPADLSDSITLSGPTGRFPHPIWIRSHILCHFTA